MVSLCEIAMFINLLKYLEEGLVNNIISFMKPYKFKSNNELKSGVNFWCNKDTRELCEKIYGYITKWNISRITRLDGIFTDYPLYSGYLYNWNISHVTHIDGIEKISFYSRDASNVTNMCDMFYGAISFNQPIRNWNVSNITIMSEMIIIPKIPNIPKKIPKIPKIPKHIRYPKFPKNYRKSKDNRKYPNKFKNHRKSCKYKPNM